MSSLTPFTSRELPVEVDYLALTSYLTDAHRALASLDATIRQMPNQTLFMRTFATKEAVLSSRIEGTVATLSEVLAHEAEPVEENSRIDDITEIINYRHALEFGINHIEKDNPITENFVKELHSILLEKGRGQNKAPGKFRSTQVYIGTPGARKEDARYVPTAPQNIISAFSNLEHYINSNEEKDPLVKIALAHYQFEAIHPFVDGNGRVGRLLIMLELLRDNIITFPYLYLSEYFEANRRDYYTTLNDVSQADDYIAWIRFFLTGLKEQAEEIEKTALKIVKLHEDYKDKVLESNSKYARALLDAMFQHPVFDVSLIQKTAGIKNKKTLHNLINKFLDLGFIESINPGAQRDRLYAFTDLLRLARGDE